MSIGKIQEKILTQKGCGTAIAIGMAFVMSFFIFGQCARSGSASGINPDSTASSSPVVTIGDYTVTSAQISEAVTQSTQNMPASSFASTTQSTSGAIGNLLTNAAYEYIAKRDHIDLTDAAIMQAASGVIDEEFEMRKMQMQLKPGASQAEVDAAFKKQLNMTPAEAKKKALDNVKTLLAKPDSRRGLLDKLIGPVVESALSLSMKPSDAEVKASYDTYVLKRILISKTPGVDAKAKAQEALKAVQGGMSFEAAMDKFSGEPPQGPGKKISDNILNIPRSMMSMRPSYKALDGQKVGFVSPILDDPEGESIYKIIAIKNDAPKDFDANKEKYRKQYSQQQVQSKLQDEVKAVLDSKDVKWDNKGYEALYDFTKTYSMQPAERDAALQKIADEAQAAVKNPAEKQPALEAWYEAETGIYQGNAINKAKLVPGRIEMLNAVLQDTEDYDIRMELVDLDIQQKKGDDALQNLIAASKANTNYDNDGQKKFGDLAAKADSLVKDKLVTEAALKPFRDAQDSWKKNKADEDRNNADMAIQEAKQKAEDAANEKANEEALKKQKASMAKTAPGKTPGPSAPTPQSGAALPPNSAAPPSGATAAPKAKAKP